MRFLVASDIHGSLAAAEAVAAAFEKEGADRLLLLGDLFEGGAKDENDKKTIADILNRFGACTLAVRGNCDTDEDAAALRFALTDPVLFFRDGSRELAASHGSRYNDACPPPYLSAGAVLFCGHTHCPAFRNCGSFTYVNPGSAGLPRGGSTAGYAVYEEGSISWKTLDGSLKKTVRIF